MIGNKLNFKSHINELYQKPSQKIGALCRLSKFLNNSTKKQVSTQLQNPNSTIVLLYECSAQEHQTTKSTNYMRRSLRIILNDYSSGFNKLLENNNDIYNHQKEYSIIVN